MSQTVYYCTPEEDIHSALKTMRREKVRRLPVVNSNGVIEGVVSMNDVALHAEKFDGHKTTALSYDDVVSTLKAICEHRHPKAAKESRVATP
jgi:CBS domain-containing protein